MLSCLPGNLVKFSVYVYEDQKSKFHHSTIVMMFHHGQSQCHLLNLMYYNCI